MKLHFKTTRHKKKRFLPATPMVVSCGEPLNQFFPPSITESCCPFWPTFLPAFLTKEILLFWSLHFEPDHRLLKSYRMFAVAAEITYFGNVLNLCIHWGSRLISVIIPPNNLLFAILGTFSRDHTRVRRIDVFSIVKTCFHQVFEVSLISWLYLQKQ